MGSSTNHYTKVESAFDLWKQGRKNAAKATWEELPQQLRKQLTTFTIGLPAIPDPEFDWIDMIDQWGTWTISKAGKYEGKVTLELQDLRELIAEIATYKVGT